MRATRRRWGSAAVIGVWVALLLAVGLASLDEHGRAEHPPPRSTTDAFVDAWQRSLTATYYARGTFERRSDVTGSSIGSEDVVAQEPPRRLHRQLGGIDGRDDDRLLVCPAPPKGGGGPQCQLGPPGGPTYAEDVTSRVLGMRTLVDGADPVYRVRADGPGCFSLDQTRSSPGAPFGVQARYCFDDDTGALIDATVTYAAGVHEDLAVEDLRPPVAADFVP